MAKLVAHVYAEALFEVAVQMDELKKFGEELAFVSDTFKEYPKFFEIFITPRISKEERKNVMENVFKDKVSEQMLNFIKILIDKRRGMVIHDIYRLFVKMANDKLGITNAVVESAVELTEEEKIRIKDTLVNMTGQVVELECVVKPQILGGLVINMGNKVIDASVQSRLNEMKSDLAELIV